MKAMLGSLIIVLLLSCKVQIEPTCKDFVLEPTNWKYCNPINPHYSCGYKTDTLERKTIKIINDALGETKYSLATGRCITNDTYGTFTAVNLPECFWKDGIKIRYSGIVKEGNSPYARCGLEFELTKLEEIP